MKPRDIPTIDAAGIMRFWSHVQINDPSECWPWTSTTGDSKGFKYGTWEYSGVTWKAPRIAYTLLIGPIPDGLTLDHVRTRGCTSKLCCNPAHLEPVTQSVNTLRQYSSPDRLYPLTCKTGHIKEFGRANCRKCNVLSVAATMKANPAKYVEMKRLQKRKERARAKKVIA